MGNFYSSVGMMQLKVDITAPTGYTVEPHELGKELDNGEWYLRRAELDISGSPYAIHSFYFDVSPADSVSDIKDFCIRALNKCAKEASDVS